MKRKILFIAIIMIFAIVMFAQNVSAKTVELEWEELYATDKSHNFHDMVKTQDGGFIAVGYISENGNRDGIIVKYDSNHKIEWEKTYGYDGTDQFSAITPTLDGNFMVVGYSDSFELSYNGFDMIIVKYDINGNVLKEQSISFEKDDYASDIIETSKGKFIVVGRTDSNNAGTNAGADDGIIIKLDKELVVEGTNLIGKTGLDELYRVVETKDGKFIVTGSIQNEESMYPEALIAKFNEKLEEEWQTIEEVKNEKLTSINSIIITSDGNILTVGAKQGLMPNIPTGIITKRSNDGKIIWHKEIEGTKEEAAFFNDVIELSTGGHIAVGELSKQLPDGMSAEWVGLIIKYDENGNIEWKKTHGEASEQETFTKVIENKNREIVAMGEKNSTSSSSSILRDRVFVGHKEYLKTIEVTNVIEPLEGETPVSTGITIPEGVDYEIDTISWHVSDTEDGDYDKLGENEKFKVGKYYKLQLEFVTKNNYEFSSPIEATINGKTAIASTTYTDAQAFATLEFGKLEKAKEYNVIEGANQTYTIGKSDSAVFKIDAEFSKFKNIMIDGKEVTDFTAKSGSTIITLDKSYLETLSVGEHTLVATFTDGRATTKFTIAKKSSPGAPGDPGTTEQQPTTPTEDDKTTPNDTNNVQDDGTILQTGDNISLYITIFVVSILGLVTTFVVKRKK